MTQALEESLINYFKQTNVSAAIIKTFARANEPLSFNILVEGVRMHVGNRIPEYALENTVRTSLRLLKASGWVVKSENTFELTDLGRELSERISD